MRPFQPAACLVSPLPCADPLARAVVFGLEGARLNHRESAFFRDADPWAFILFARNVETPDQLRRLTDDLRDAVGRDAVIMIDQEGGRVARMAGPHWTEWPNALEQMRLNASLDAVRLRYQIIGLELRAVGITANCAPVLDVARAGTHPVLKSRCFGFDAETVSAAGRACVDGLMSAGVLPVMKHIPGHGLGTVDSHVGVPVVEADLDALDAVDFAPFRALNDVPMGMTSHVLYTAIDDVVGTVSPRVINVIRRQIGFDGLLMTDDLSMGALGGTHAERARGALAAGCDLILHCSGEMHTMLEVLPELPMLVDKSWERAKRAINCGQPQDIVDIEDLLAEYRAIMSTDSQHA